MCVYTMLITLYYAEKLISTNEPTLAFPFYVFHDSIHITYIINAISFTFLDIMCVKLLYGSNTRIAP